MRRTARAAPCHDPATRLLRGQVPAHFEAFYRRHLRFRSGCRIRSCEVVRRYGAWAVETDAPALGLRQVARAMRNIGHRHFRSNVTFYGDVTWAEDVPALADNYPVLPREGLARDGGDQGLLRQIDKTVTELAKLRTLVEHP